MADNIFDKVLENIDITNVVSEYVKLEPKGKNLFGLCPFHDDNNPSMSVSKEKGIFYCFVCKTGGNAIKFLELYKHISYLDATKELARNYHIDISEFNLSTNNTKQKYYDQVKISEKFYEFLMNDENLSKDARTYLLNRGITEEAIKEFNIGLSPNNKDALVKQLENKGFLLPDIELNGLANSGNDVFTDRIMIPIKNENGVPIAFGGRTYKEGSTQSKYQNSTETPIFKKGETIFNLNNAIKYLKTLPYLIIHEGYMDVIQAASKGIKNTVALMGTQITDDQVNLIKKYTDNVVICLDGDMPGIKAVLPISNALERVNIRYSIVILPNNSDPDEFLRKYGKDEYLNYLNNKKLDKIGYIYELTKREFGSLSTFNMDSFKNTIFEKIKNEKSKTTLEIYLKKLSNDLNVSFESIKQDFDSFLGIFKPKNNIDEFKNFKVEGAFSKAEKLCVEYAIESREYYKYIENEMSSRIFLKNKDLRNMFIEIGDIYDLNPKIIKDDLILELKNRDVYNNYFHDNKIKYEFDDLKLNILKKIKNNDFEIRIKNLKLELVNNEYEKEKKDSILKEIKRLQKEIRR